MAISWKRVSEDRWDEMLGVLPPAYWDGKGFLVGEAWTHKGGVPAFAPFIERSGEFYEGTAPMTIAEFRALNPGDIVSVEG